MDDKVKRNTKVNKAVEDFGGLLREYRLEHQLSLNDLSIIIGYSTSFICRVEKYTRFPELETRLKMLLNIWSEEDVYIYLQEIITKEKNATQ